MWLRHRRRGGVIRVFRLVLPLIGLLGLTVYHPQEARAQEVPDEAQVNAFITSELPAYWTLEDVEVRHVEKTDGSNPRYVVRFLAHVWAAQDLYATVETLDPFILVMKSADAGRILKLQGVLDASLRNGSWIGGVDLSSDPTNFGQPLDRFTGPVIDVDSAEAAPVLAKLAQADLAERTLKIERDNREQLRQANALGQKRLDEARAGFDAELAQMKATGSAELLELITANNAKRTALIAQQDAEMSQLRAGLAAERRSLQKQIEAASDVLTMQVRLKLATRTIADNEAELLSNFNALRVQRLAFFKGLPATWKGHVTCHSPEQNRSHDHQLVLTTPDKQPGGFSGKLDILGVSNGRGREVSVATIGEGLAFPLALKFVTDVDHRFAVVPNAFTLKLHADGRLVGEETTRIYLSGRDVEFKCSFKLSG